MFRSHFSECLGNDIEFTKTKYLSNFLVCLWASKELNVYQASELHCNKHIMILSNKIFPSL